MKINVHFILENNNIETLEFCCIDYLDFTIQLYKKIIEYKDLVNIEPFGIVVKIEKK